MRIIILALLILPVLTGTACLQKTQTDTTTAVISVPLLPDPGSQPAPYSIYLLPVSTDQQGALVPGEAIRLTGEGETYIHPHWSPGGEWIAFFSTRDGNAELYAMRSDGSQLTRLTNHPADDRQPHWSPDGRTILFISIR